MNTVIKLSKEDFNHLISKGKGSFSFKESNSFAVTTASENEIVTLCYKNDEVQGIVKKRYDTNLDRNTKQIDLDIELL